MLGEDGDPRTRAKSLTGARVLAGLWSGEPFSYSGKHYRIKDACFLPRPVQSPRIPIWPCGTWSSKKAPFRRAAQWDGVIAILDPSVNRAILPDEVRAIRTYMQRLRANGAPFDVTVHPLVRRRSLAG